MYLRLLQGDSAVEVDCQFSLTLRCLPAAMATAPKLETVTQRGLTFRCGMTFCDVSTAGNSVGRCEDWGAHVYPSDLLLQE